MKKKPDETQQLIIEESWKEIGFHRPLGGILQNLIYIILTTSLGVLYTSWIMPYFIFPFPTGIGYTVTVANLFGFGYTLMDLGTGLALQRYVSEYNIKNPQRSLKYLQFFVTFQMITGLLQVTVISVWVLFFLSSDELIYVSWILLLYSTRQYPGMLSVFQGAIKAYQRFDKSNKLYFIHIVLLESTTKLVCILIGRYLGGKFPIMGELMGATLGSVIGAYLDDFLAAIIGAYWLKPILQEINPFWGIRDIFRIDYGWPLAKECLLYGLRPLIAMLIWPVGNLIATAILINNMPNYATFIGIYSFADFLGSFVGVFFFEISPPLSESYNNGKMHLSGDYITRVYKWYGFTGTFIAGIMYSAAPIFGLLAGDRFNLLTPMLRILVLFNFFNLFCQLQDAMFNGVAHPEYNIILVGVDQGVRVFVLYIMVVIIPSGWQALVWSFGLGRIMKWIVGYLLFNKFFFKISVNLWQTFGAPLSALVPELIFAIGFYRFLFPTLESLLGTMIAGGIVIIIGSFLGPFFIHFILVSLLGGWDDSELKHFKRAAEMAGPSRFLARPMYRLTEQFTRHSKLHNRFPINTTNVDEEIRELMETRAIQIKSE